MLVSKTTIASVIGILVSWAFGCVADNMTGTITSRNTSYSQHMGESCIVPETSCPETDYVFVMDESDSVSYLEFAMMRDFVQGIVAKIPNDESARIGVVEFGREAGIYFELDQNRTNVDNRIAAAFKGGAPGPDPGGNTQTEKAVLLAIDMLNNTERNRVIILLTDGQPFSEEGCLDGTYSICDPGICDQRRYVGDDIANFKSASESAEALVILVGIGGIVDSKIDCLASPGATYEGNFEDLEKIGKQLVNAASLCLLNEPPQARCKDVQVIHYGGPVTITPEDVDDGSTDPEEASLTFSLDKTTILYPFEEVANVTLTVTDGQNTCTCISTVTLIPAPSAQPSSVPTSLPSQRPSVSTPPSKTPTQVPSKMPTAIPSSTPSAEPSGNPSISSNPSTIATYMPTMQPSATTIPSYQPSKNPTVSVPSALPSSLPSTFPSELPSSLPTSQPSDSPTISSIPSTAPSSSFYPTPSAMLVLQPAPSTL
ncbi:hypothetical protein ACA910_007481 [Epithemia clementina (nom. ined.)]